MPTARITKQAVDALQTSPKEMFLWDDQLRGFGLRSMLNDTLDPSMVEQSAGQMLNHSATSFSGIEISRNSTLL